MSVKNAQTYAVFKCHACTGVVRYVGCDECGKGEIFGDMILCSAELSDENYDSVSDMLKTADTKRKRTASAWVSMGKALSEIGIKEKTARIRPSDILQGETARVMDDAYMDLIDKMKPDSDTRVLVDDYGIGRRFRSYLDGLDCKAVAEHGADGRYAEVRAASVIAKTAHAKMMSTICANPKYEVRGFLPGSGNCGDFKTKRWLREWYGSGRPWPSFVKTWWAPVRRIEAGRRTGRPQ